MKLLMLGWELPPYNSGGLGVACLHMAKALAARGDIDIQFVLPYDAKHEKAEQYLDIIPASNLPPMMDEKGDFLSLGVYAGVCLTCKTRDCEHAEELSADLVGATKKYAIQVARMLKKRKMKPQVIHAHDWLTMEAGVRAREICKVPLVIHVHATEFERAGCSRGNQLIWDIEYNGFMMADRIFAVSQHTKDIIVKEYGIPADKIEVVYNALDIDGLIETTVETDNYLYVKEMKRQGYTIVGANSRLTVMKGLPYLLEAAALAMSRNPKLLFVLVSSGEMRDQLIELAADLGISDRVIFTGFVRGQRWREFYELIDIFTLPSMVEPFGLTALEAAHYGSAVLVSKTSGVREVMQNVMDFDYWDTRRLADEIINISLSPALMHDLRAGAKREYLNISWDDIAEQLTHQYEKVSFHHRNRHQEHAKNKKEHAYV